MGVKQGNAMAAVLFILVMQVMAETLTPPVGTSQNSNAGVPFP
jgi:hypothetical protein